MRRRLIGVFVAVSTMVALAFVIPLAFLVRATAEDRAMDAARADTVAVIPVLVSGGSRAQIESALGATASGREGRMTVVTSQGWLIGPALEGSSRMEAALTTGQSGIGRFGSGVEVVAAVATGPDELSAVRVFVPESDLHRGQWKSWAALGGVAVILVGISVVVADRLARSVTRPAQSLVTAARSLGEGDLDQRVSVEGPPELGELAGVFNNLGDRVRSMLESERELVADLSHRLRTPLTKLRLRIDQVDDPDLRSELEADLAGMAAELDGLITEARSSLQDRSSGAPSRQCDAVPVVADRAGFWRVLAEDQKRDMRLEIAEEPVPVAVSEGDLAAALDVLLENVFSHTDEGVPLAVGLAVEGDEVRIRVSDGGRGVGADRVERGTSGAGSTGLGLDIARRTAETAGGRLEVSVAALGGAEITLVLPRPASPSPG